MYNFYNEAKKSGGIFVGINSGGIEWDEKLYTGTNDAEYFFGSLGFNVGIRSKFSAHNIEFGAKIPFANENVITETRAYKLTMKENYNLFLRYIYDFEF